MISKDRVKRYIARTTPDRITFRVNMNDPDNQAASERWMYAFVEKMGVKHKGQGHVDVCEDPTLGFWPGQRVFIAQWRRPSRAPF